MSQMSVEDYSMGAQDDDAYAESLHNEPVFDAFVCPLTGVMMHDPVTLENGQTFEREAIEKWLKDCRDKGKEPVCPVTLTTLNTVSLNPNISLRNIIEEWCLRRDATRLRAAIRSIPASSSPGNLLRFLSFVQKMWQRSNSHKNIVRDAKLIPVIANLLGNENWSVRCQALRTLRVLADDDDNKEAMTAGGILRTAVKFLYHDLIQEREEAIFLLYELSKSQAVSERIAEINGAILMLVGMASSISESTLITQCAEKVLENLETSEKNLLLMAENGRLQPLLKLFLEGSYETQLAMASSLGDLPLSNDMKDLVAKNAGPSLVKLLSSDMIEAREASLKALNQISSCESSARLLINMGIVPYLVRDLLTSGNNHVPLSLKEASAAILANLVAAGGELESVVLADGQALISENVIHDLLLLVSNTGPAIQSKLLQVLVGFTSSSASIQSLVAAVKSSGAVINVIQFIEVPQLDFRAAAIILLCKIAPYMSQELSNALCETKGQLAKLLEIISDDSGDSEERAAAIGFLANLPENDYRLIQSLIQENAFDIIISKLILTKQGRIRGGRYVNPYIEGLVRVLSKLTYFLDSEASLIPFAQENDVASLFVDFLQSNALDNVQMYSANALKNLSLQSKHLSKPPKVPPPSGWARVFPWFCTRPKPTGICCLHSGVCSLQETFCLLDGRAVERLIACLDQSNEKVVEAALTALCTLLEDVIDIGKAVSVLRDADGIEPILQVLVKKRSQTLRRKAVWAVERLLRTDVIAYEVAVNPNISTALIEAYRHGDGATRQNAERALKRIEKLPNFSRIF